MNVLFSIIIPTYNSSDTICNCIDSILSQSFLEFEIIVIDGKSTDDTFQKVKLYNDNRINVHSGRDLGVYDAMNKGIKLSNGNWILFLGSDDFMFSNDVLEKVKNKIISDDSISVYYGNVFSARFGGVYDFEFDKEKILNKNICHQSIIFNRKVFNVVGCFNLRYPQFADWDHNLRWFFSEKIKSKYIDIIVAFYADNGISSRIGDERFNREKIFNYLLYGYKNFDYVLRLKFLKSEFKRVTNVTHKRHFLKLLMKTPRILTGI
jgi:glycosyltransferase involved in cell wall biosynthesis